MSDELKETVKEEVRNEVAEQVADQLADQAKVVEKVAIETAATVKGLVKQEVARKAKTPWQILAIQITLGVLTGALAMSDQILKLPFIPPSLAMLWPLLAIAIPTVINPMLKKFADWFDDGELNDSYKG